MITNKCQWELATPILYEDSYYVYNTACGHQFEAVINIRIPVEEKIKFCPWCGRQIEEWMWEWE